MIKIRQHLLFTCYIALLFLAVYALGRLSLLLYNLELAGQSSATDIALAFLVGLRFDAKMTAIILLPMIIGVGIKGGTGWRGFYRWWSLVWLLTIVFLTVLELDFYATFQQRLNDLVLVYVNEDPATVVSMLWHGFPVVRYLAVVAVVSGSGWLLIKRIDLATNTTGDLPSNTQRLVLMVVLLLIATLVIRGTLRQGPPLRWGDAFITNSIFTNHLGLNGSFTLGISAIDFFGHTKASGWDSKLKSEVALELTRKMMLSEHDQLVDPDEAPIRRLYTPPQSGLTPPKNVVIVLMESFSAEYTDAYGHDFGLTPNFDALSKEGVLFTRAFSNGTHTHQGTFATLACFPNLPGYEYIMQQQAGTNTFSGLPALLKPRGFDDIYVYNGDFAWDNQYGFFHNQGMQNFFGRNEYVNPVFADPTWGVSDQDMFDQALIELDKLAGGEQPFMAILQTLSNHEPYSLPTPLAIDEVTQDGEFNIRYTSIKYADWALGRFFDEVRKKPFYKDTLFVVLGDHGVTTPNQVTGINLARFHIPLLFIYPGMQEAYGTQRDTVATQIDVVPSIMGVLGEPVQHQCWGRDLFGLPEGDKGIGVIKPSGGEQIAAILRDDRILVKGQGIPTLMYEYGFDPEVQARMLDDPEQQKLMETLLDAFIVTATNSVKANSSGP